MIQSYLFRTWYFLYDFTQFHTISSESSQICRGCTLVSALHYCRWSSMIMRKWVCIVPVLLLAGCSRTNAPGPGAQVGAEAKPAAESAASAASAPSPPAKVIPNGTPLHVRIDESIDTRRNRVGDRFSATLSEPIEVGGRTLVPAGTRFSGRVTTAAAPGRLKGRPSLGLNLASFRLNGRDDPVQTTRVH